MKRKLFKFTGVGLALVLMLSMLPFAGLVGAAGTYAGLELGTKESGATATWATGPVDVGNYSAHLNTGSSVTGDEGRLVIPMPPGTTLGDITSISWSVRAATGYPPHVDIYMDVDGDEVVDDEDVLTAEMYYNNADPISGLVAWVGAKVNHNVWLKTFELTADDGYGAIDGSTLLWAPAFGGGPGDAPNGTLAEWQAGEVTDDPQSEWPSGATLDADTPVLRLEIEVDRWMIDSEAYIDDVIISGVTYEIEPMVLDATGYNTGDTVSVTVLNGNASGTIGIFAKADTLGEAGKISIALSETGTGTGVFTGSFTLVDTTPGTGELLVNDGDSIDVYYNGDWGAGGQELGWTAPPSAYVDDTAPAIAINLPLESDNITDTTPEIKATLTDGGSGIDEATIVLKLDDVDPPVMAIPDTDHNYDSGTGVLDFTPASGLTYETLTDGDWYVTVDVSDMAGNAATQASWSFTVDTGVPVITDQVATPPTILPSVASLVVFTANVTDATSGVASVVINLTNVGGTAALAMLDDGVAPDMTADDGIYTASENITESSEANYTLPVDATDNAGNTATTADITLGVWTDIVAPVITVPAITYEYGSSVLPGGTVTISANVTDDVGMGTVAATADTDPAFSATLVDDGTGVDVTASDGIYTGEGTVNSGVGWGDYTLTITATDAKGNEATDETLILAVRSGATGAVIALEEGWNLISLPLIPDSADIATVISNSTLASGNVSSVGIVRGYDPASGLFPSYMPGSGGDLTEMNDGVGYWIFMNTADTLTVTGRQWPSPPAVPPSYDVVVGWNMIGVKSLVDITDTLYLANIAATYPVIWSYNAVSGAYVNVESGTMEWGHGFWIWITEAGTIVPPG